MTLRVADGTYETADGSPIDITKSLCSGNIGGGSPKYAAAWDRIFANTEAKPPTKIDNAGDTQSPRA